MCFCGTREFVPPTAIQVPRWEAEKVRPSRRFPLERTVTRWNQRPAIFSKKMLLWRLPVEDLAERVLKLRLHWLRVVLLGGMLVQHAICHSGQRAAGVVCCGDDAGSA